MRLKVLKIAGHVDLTTDDSFSAFHGVSADGMF